MSSEWDDWLWQSPSVDNGARRLMDRWWVLPASIAFVLAMGALGLVAGRWTLGL